MPTVRYLEAAARSGRWTAPGWWATLSAMKTQLHCPCGEQIRGVDEDDLVEKTQKHLREEHDGREYSRDEILFMAY
jgi:predicted small metal-binding protein